MSPCPECYSQKSRITPLLGPKECLAYHEQYVCGTCGRCICIAKDEKRGLQRWTFPFKSKEAAILYLRTADATTKRPCGVYEISGANGRLSYKIFPDEAQLRAYLQKNPGKTCPGMKPVFTAGEYREYPNTQIRLLSKQEADAYLAAQRREKGV